MASSSEYIWGSKFVTREGLLQKITLLTILNPVQERPQTYKLVTRQRRTLTVAQEAEVASNLAFLSRRSAESHNVAAIGLEEESNRGMTVRVTVNGKMLDSVVEGLIRICNTLQCISQNGALLSDNIELLLSEVVRLNLSRLRSRLKLKKRNSVDNGPIAQLVKFYRGTNRDLDSGKVLLELDSLTRVFKSAPSSPPTSSTCQTAMTIVKLASKLTTTDFLDIVGRCVSGQDRLARCIDTVRKIGQYYRATKQLVVAATAIHSRVLFQHIQVCPFRIEVPSCVRTIVCVDTGAKQAALHAAVLSRLNKQRSGLKIHAEIQLLFFYEQHQVACPPRVIVASKASCYLCNLFLELHGKFQVVSSYGKLNERWILPDWLHGINSQQRHQLCYIVEQFYAALSAKCEAGVFKKKLPDPIESLIAISAVWNESVLTTPSLTCCEPEGIPSSQHATPPTVIKAQRRETRLLTECELPYIFAIHPGLQRLTVEFGTLRLIFDFESHSASALSISQDGEEGSAVEVDALTIPTTSAVEVSRRTDSHDTVFRIRHGRIYIDIKIFGSGSGSQAI